MSMQDPIADMLTRIRNGQSARKTSVAMPSSTKKVAIAEVLTANGYVSGYNVESEGAKSTLTVDLKYFQGSPVIDEIARVSRPGRRVYVQASEIPRVRNGLGVALISTSKGVITGKSAKEQGIGGEVVCTVF